MRKARGLSLQEVAVQADVSAATLSRIETRKQAIDVALLLDLARILECEAGDLLDERPDRPVEQELAKKIASLQSSERLRLWGELRLSANGAHDPRSRSRLIAIQLEELLAQLDFVREEIVALRRTLPR